MPVISLIGCEILEDEITHVLSEHRQKSRIVLIDDIASMGLAKKLRLLNIPFSKTPIDKIDDFVDNKSKNKSIKKEKPRSRILSRILGSLGSSSDLLYVVKIMDRGLHNDHHLLRNSVEQQIIEMSRFSDGIFLFYGLCGNALRDIDKVVEGLECELYVPTDKDGQIVDDCVSIAVGGNKVYDDLFKKYRGTGTLFFTPMWAAKWDFSKQITQDISGKNGNSFFSEKIGRIVQIDTGMHFEKDFRGNVSTAAKEFDAEVSIAKGSTEIIDSWYPKARDDLIKKSKNKSETSD